MRIAFFGDSLTEGNPGASAVELLQKKVPEHAILNYGKGGDTVHSLLKRVRRLHPGPLDMAFVWIGVNDVLARVHPAYAVLKLLRRQMWTASALSFARRYGALLDLLEHMADGVWVVPPLLIGEDVTNRWNKTLENLNHRIEALCRTRGRVRFVDLRPVFTAALQGRESSSFDRKGRRSFWPRLFSPKGQIAGQGGKGLCTVDGIHLNATGARMAADCFEGKIREESR